MEITINKICKEEINSIKPLWEQLNLLHLEDSVHFKDHFSTFTFEQRADHFKDTNPEDIQIEVAKDVEKGNKPVGYCISTARDTTGELDSIFVDPDYRGRKIGDRLAESSIKWMKKKGCTKISVAVSYGHESVFPFYKKLGFFPRVTHLHLKQDYKEPEQ